MDIGKVRRARCGHREGEEASLVFILYHRS